ncbi:class I SAM-dependent methyltransferase [Actinokineospora sp. NPDC004072]
MPDRVADSTAEAATLLRAAGALLPDKGLRGPDFMAARFIPWSPRAVALVKVPGVRGLLVRALLRAWPGAVWYEVVRTRHMDQVLRDEVADGASQVVILGAGFDSRAYRLARDLAGTTVYEVDHPDTSARKRERLRAVVKRIPGNVRYVTVDLNHQDLAEALAGKGFDPAVRTIVIWSGVAPYLTPDGVERTLRWMATQHPDSGLVFDYCWQEVLDGTSDNENAITVARWVAGRGEPWRSGIPEGRTADYLAGLGLRAAEDLTIPQTRDRYLGERPEPIWDFGGFVLARPRARG